MTAARTELALDTVTAYLEQRGLLPAGVDPSVRALGGGVSNTVLVVRWDEGCLVLKQPLANLAVEEDWPADVLRVHNEAAAVRVFHRLLRDLDSVTVPSVTLEDERNHVVGLECIPTRATTWKAELLGGRVDESIASSLGRALGAVHVRAAGDPEIRERFDDPTPFEQLRLDPYHRTVADRHPALAEPVLAEVDRVASVDRTLVHGDYSPKNVLVDRAGDGPTCWLIDFEVAHLGDPAFDVAFMANHLFIKALHVADRRSDLLEAAAAFWDAYCERVPWNVERAVVAELGVLILARVDGKSPVEYVEEGPVATAMRRVGTRTVGGEAHSLVEFTALVREEAP